MPLILFCRTFAPEIETDNYLTITLLNKLKRMKKVITLMLALVAAMVVNAKTVETTLWEGTYSGEVGLNAETVATFKAGDILRVYVTVPAGGANFKIVYKGAPDWDETTIPSINNQWPWVDGGETYKEFTLTADDITAFSGKNIYIYKGDYSTIEKVTLLTEEADDPVEVGTATELWTGTNAFGNWGNFESLRYDNKGALANAKVGDDIRVTFTNATNGWQVYVCDADSYGEFAGGYFDGAAKEEAQSVSFRIANATVLEAIQFRGIVVKGKLATLTKIEIVTYATSYDAVPLTIGEDGVCTYGSSKNLDFSGITDVIPYYVSETNTGSVKLKSVDITRAWAGYVVKGVAGTYTVPVADSEPEWLDAFNNLRYSGDYNGNWVYRSVYSDYSDGGDNETKIKTYYRYIFAKKGTDIGFYKLSETYERMDGENKVYYHILGAHKAYLETPTDITPSTSSARVSLVFDDDTTTGVEFVAMPSQPAASGCYDLQGRQVKNPTKGLYIVNGKKIMVK